MYPSRKHYMAFAAFLLILSSLAYAASNEADVKIIVIDKHGDPIEEAEVTLTCQGNGTNEETAETDEDGEAEFEVYVDSDNEDFDIIVTAEDYEDYETDEDDGDPISNLEEGDDVEETVILRPETDDLVVFVKLDGADLEDADVTVESIDDSEEPYDYEEEKETDEDGRASFEDIETDTKYKITVEKSGFLTVTEEIELDLADGASTTIDLVEPGEGTISLTLLDSESNEPIVGAKVEIMNHDTRGGKQSEDTNEDGIAIFEVGTPACYDAEASASRYGEKSVDTVGCLNEDGDEVSLTILLDRQNNAPKADAGADQYLIEGMIAELDGSGSSDSDGDKMEFAWSDDQGTTIPEEESPSVTLEPGKHTITLTVTDPDGLSSSDEVIVEVDSKENCGNGECSKPEEVTKSCPKDCPVCEDSVCGVGEETTCPKDCGISVAARFYEQKDSGLVEKNVTELGLGQLFTIITRDDNTQKPVSGVEITIRLPEPNGTLPSNLFADTGSGLVINKTGTYKALTNAEGTLNVKLEHAGNYTFEASKDTYLTSSSSIVLYGGFDIMGILTYVFYIILAIAVIYLALMFFKNKKRKSSGKSGYRSLRFKKKKTSLEGGR